LSVNETKVTTELLWQAAAFTACIDLALVAALAGYVTRERFEGLKLPIWIVATIFWFFMWTWALWSQFWELVYQHLFPDFAPYVIPPIYGAMYGAFSVLFWWIARRQPWSPTIVFLILGGLVSLPGHIWAIYGLDMFERVPMLYGVRPAAALVFGVFEFIVYFSFILIVALLARWLWARRRAAPAAQPSR
jgi:hypothetical protein